ncbi:MAG: CZB domain-containing protein [Azonexus sp.]|nr:CZB domain-containing protein [Azonexus sp.]MCK6412278.1 CZB domain-containing protein [Azonexus sp.]
MNSRPGSALEVLLIQVGSKTFALPLAAVRYIDRMPPEFCSSGAGVEDYFVFEEEALSFISLWDRLGQDSAYAEYDAMQQMLPQRRQDHLDWMSALEHSLRSGAPFSKARNPHDCAFGQWFYAYRPSDRRLSLLLSQFEQPHAIIHGLADRLLAMVDHGQQAAALAEFETARDTTLATLMQLFDSASQLIVELQRRIAVILGSGEQARALGADAVRDIVLVPPERCKSPHGSGPVAGLILLDDGHLVPLIDWKRL